MASPAQRELEHDELQIPLFIGFLTAFSRLEATTKSRAVGGRRKVLLMMLNDYHDTSSNDGHIAKYAQTEI